MSTNFLLVLAGLVAIGFYFWLTRQSKVHADVLEKLDFPGSWKVTRAEPLQIGGVIDLLVKAPDGRIFAIQVKTQFKHLTYQKNYFGEALVLPDGRKLNNPSPIDEALSNAQVIAAEPVLWLPFVPKSRPKVSKKGVLMVFGPRRQLFKALKVK